MRPNFIHFAIVAVLLRALSGADLVDITGQGTASQTSDWPTGAFPASNALDGDPNTFSHTDSSTPNNAWELSFAEDREVARVELSMRADCCGGRLSGATLRWFDGEGDSVFNAVIDDPGIGATAVFELPPGTIARSLRVGFENGAGNPGTGSTNVHLGEVRVFEAVDLLPVITAFTATPASIDAGATVALAWQTEAADSVEIIGIGVVANSGSTNESPAASQIYTLVASNTEGSRTASVAVIVDGVILPPRVNEFMASNDTTIVRSDGSTPDWIEIWNPNPIAIDLAGYRLTDDPEQPARYVFPSISVAAGEYLVVDAATGSVDGVPATGFALDRSAGNTLTLADPSGTALQSITYPKQRADVSFGVAADGGERFFLIPTPGEANATSSVSGFVADTEFSLDRGFYDTAQSVAITTATPGATIFVTTDGSEPSPDNVAASAHTAPINIATTTVLRAAAFLDGWQPTDIDTQTYIFAADIGAQSSSPAGFPQSWVPNQNGVQAPVSALSHFGMHNGVIASLPLNDSDGASFDLVDALTDIPSMSLVIDADELFDPVDGLHINANQRGRAWERPASIEFIDPATGEASQANCGLRMHGGWNRFPEMLKKSFRLYFRSEYGDSKFSHPLFPELDRDEFDRLILRSGNGKAWSSPWRALSGNGNSLERTTYMRDQLARDLQAATGNTHIPGTFVHLYINGHYWGLYNPVERPDEQFAAARFGGDHDDYDVIKWSRGIGHRVAAGDDVAWNALIALVRGNTSDPATYAAVGEALDLTNFVDYMLVNYFLGNQDWIDNNVYAMRNREAGGPFRFFCWDSEESLLSVGIDVTGREVIDTCTEIHQALRDNAEYRQLFADRAQKFFFNGGALTPAAADAIFADHAAALDRAIVAESARWGSLLRPSNPYDRDDWLGEVDNLRNNYLSTRTATTLAQLRADSLFSPVEAPSFSPQRGGQVDAGFGVILEAPVGTIYYTTDGSDPRLPGGGVSPSSTVFAGGTQSQELVSLASDWSYLDDGSDQGSSDLVAGAAGYGVTNWKHPNFDDASWASAPAPLGYGGISGRPVVSQVSFGPDGGDKYTTTYFRRDFPVAGAATFTSLDLRLARDDGAIVYINGQEVARSGLPGGTTVQSDTFADGVSGAAEGALNDFALDPSVLVESVNTIAVELHQASLSSSDLGFDLELSGQAPLTGGVINIDEDTFIRTRVLDGGTWSAIDEALYVVGSRADDLYVSELMYHPATGGAEFLEISNRGAVTHTLADLRLTGGIRFDFSNATVGELAPGARLVLVREPVAFAAAYPAVDFAGEYDGALGNGGDSFSLEQSDDATLLWTITYSDDAPWPGGTDGDGHSLTFIEGDPDQPIAWRPSVVAGGTPGGTDSVEFAPGGDLIGYAAIGAQIDPDRSYLVSSRAGADAIQLSAEWSTDLSNWSRDGLERVSVSPAGSGRMLSVWRMDQLPGPRLYFRSVITERE